MTRSLTSFRSPISKIDGLIKQTASITGIPEYRVRMMVKHQFKELNNQFRNPTKPVIRMSGMGMFELTLSNFRRGVFYYTSKIREYRDAEPKIAEDYRNKLRDWWKLRKQISDKYYKR